jgi:hypothetical protein
LARVAWHGSPLEDFIHEYFHLSQWALFIEKIAHWIFVSYDDIVINFDLPPAFAPIVLVLRVEILLGFFIAQLRHSGFEAAIQRDFADGKD